MTEENAFLTAVKSRPDDRTPRLVGTLLVVAENATEDDE